MVAAESILVLNVVGILVGLDILRPAAIAVGTRHQHHPPQESLEIERSMMKTSSRLKPTVQTGDQGLPYKRLRTRPLAKGTARLSKNNTAIRLIRREQAMESEAGVQLLALVMGYM